MPIAATDMTMRNAQMLREHPFRLAPMAGVTDPVYRSIFYAHGCPLAYTEMVSVAGLAFDSERTWELVDPAPEEPVVAVQLFGSKPEQFAPAARQICERLGDRLALLDINMACPVPKVFKKGEGAALMGDPDRARSIVEQTLEGAQGRVPVTVKMRTGLRADAVIACDFARMLERAGVNGIAVHGRTAAQLYHGEADWGVISQVAASVSVPVMGSGDVTSPQAAVDRLATSGCAGILVARGSYGNPWFFEDAERLLKGESKPPAHTMAQRLAAIRDHVERYEHAGGHMARLRPVVGWYVKGLPSAGTWRNQAMSCSSARDYLALVDDMERACHEHGLL